MLTVKVERPEGARLYEASEVDVEILFANDLDEYSKLTQYYYDHDATELEHPFESKRALSSEGGMSFRVIMYRDVAGEIHYLISSYADIYVTNENGQTVHVIRW